MQSNVARSFEQIQKLADFAPVSRNIKGFEVEFEGFEGSQNVLKDHPRFENWSRLAGKGIFASVQVWRDFAAISVEVARNIEAWG